VVEGGPQKLIGAARPGRASSVTSKPAERSGAYYVCGGYLAAGVSVCSAWRSGTSTTQSSTAIAKRLDRVLDREVLRARMTTLLEADKRRTLETARA
jgi:hypothetical protein